MVVVAYSKWSFTRGFKFKALSRKSLVFWIGGRLWEVVVYKRWSQMEGINAGACLPLLAEPFFYLLDFCILDKD